jgi:hypothetical protein
VHVSTRADFLKYERRVAPLLDNVPVGFGISSLNPAASEETSILD